MGRQRLSWLLAALALGMLAVFGLAWDIQWHARVGRDRFWIPPHALLYGAVAALLALSIYVAIVTTLAHRRGDPAAGEALAFGPGWRAPAGFVAAAYGLLVLIAAAPLDDYWHALHGIDVTVWAPFHVMGFLGGILARAGMVHAAFAEANRRAAAGLPESLPRLLGYVFLALLLSVTLLLALSPNHDSEYTFAWPGGRPLLLYPPLLGYLLPCFLAAAATASPRPGGATLLACCFTAWRLLVWLAVPPAVALLAGMEGAVFRAEIPDLFYPGLVWPTLLIAPALLFDLAAALATRRGWPRAWLPATGALAALLGCLLDLLDRPGPWYALLEAIGEPWQLLGMALPLAVGLGALGAVAGARLGEVLLGARG